MKNKLGLISNFGTRGIGIFLQFAFTVLIANYLPIEDSGKFFYYLSLTMLMSALVRFGAEQSFHKLAVRSCEAEVLVKLFVITITVSFFLILSSYLISVCTGIDLKQQYLIVVPAHSLIIIYSYYLRLVGKTKLGHFVEIGVVPLLFIILIILFYLFYIDLDFSNLWLVYTFSNFLVLSILVLNFKFERRYFIFRNSDEYKVYFKIILPMLYLVILNQSLLFLPVFYIEYFFSDELVAQYSVAQRISRLMVFILVVFTAYYAKRIKDYFQNEKIDEIRKLAKTSSNMMLVLCVFIILAIFLLGELVMNAMFRESYDKAFTFLIILVLGQSVNVCTGFVSYLLVLFGEGMIIAKVTFMSTIFFVMFGYYFSSKENILGLVISVSCSVAILNLVLCIYLYRKYKMKSYPHELGFRN